MRALAVMALASVSLLGAGGQARAASPFDGTYKGDFRLSGGAGQCPAGGPFTVRVTDGKFDWGTGPDRTAVTIAADGSFSAQSGRRFLNGKAANGAIAARTSGGSCDYAWTIAR